MPNQAATLTPLNRAVPAVVAGVINAVLTVIVAIAFASMLWSGELAQFASSGIGVVMFTGVVVVVLSFTSSIPCTSGVPQDTPTVIMALMAASIAKEMTGATPEQLFMTVAAGIALSTLLVGVFFFLLGQFNLATFVRFIPFPVVGGFLAGVGWLLVLGSFSVICSANPIDNPVVFFAGSTVLKWIPAVAFCVALMVVLPRIRHYLTLPGLIIGACILFYLGVTLFGSTLGEALENGWMLGPFPKGGLWRPFRYKAMGEIQWQALAAQWPSIATIMIVSTMDILLNASGIELALRKDYELNHEMRAAGITNILSGLIGGQCGWHSTTTTVLAHTIAGQTRVAGIVCGALSALMLGVGASVVELLPRCVLGGLLLFVGVGFIKEWVFDGFSRLSRGDYFIVLMCLAVIVGFGFLQGIVLGLAAGVVLFVVNYSKIDVIKHTMSRAAYRSNVDRSERHTQLLQEHGSEVFILKLQGFLFFGTANSLMGTIAARASDREARKLRIVVLDFQLVTGIDSSAVMSFTKLKQLAETEGFLIVLTSLTTGLRKQLSKDLLAEEEGNTALTFPDLDHGVEHSEEMILQEHRKDVRDEIESFEKRLAREFGDSNVTPLMSFLEKNSLHAGEALIRQYAVADDMYFLGSGRSTVELELPDGSLLRLRTMQEGTAIGEIGLYLGQPRTASVIAESECEVYRLTKESLERMEREHPELATDFHRFIIRLLAQRLADSNKTLRALLG
ncbi:MAG: SulP family inorganic anion transporter [Planctomycetota bacterium]|nr:SulP family inorganic anion transporter [Planctomycetota bacterium]